MATTGGGSRQGRPGREGKVRQGGRFQRPDVCDISGGFSFRRPDGFRGLMFLWLMTYIGYHRFVCDVFWVETWGYLIEVTSLEGCQPASLLKPQVPGTFHRSW